MSSTELEHLVKMINQIVDNITPEEGDDARVHEVAAHVKKFWAPSMIKTITEYAEDDGENLQAPALAAICLLNE